MDHFGSLADRIREQMLYRLCSYNLVLYMHKPADPHKEQILYSMYMKTRLNSYVQVLQLQMLSTYENIQYALQILHTIKLRNWLTTYYTHSLLALLKSDQLRKQM
jgi:hypothetical protein